MSEPQVARVLQVSGDRKQVLYEDGSRAWIDNADKPDAPVSLADMQKANDDLRAHIARLEASSVAHEALKTAQDSISTLEAERDQLKADRAKDEEEIKSLKSEADALRLATKTVEDELSAAKATISTLEAERDQLITDLGAAKNDKASESKPNTPKPGK